jgi:hypothetical protein
MIRVGAHLSKTLACSFCGRMRQLARKRIAGLAVVIRDRGAALCVDVLKHAGLVAMPLAQARKAPLRDWSVPIDAAFGALSRFPR